LIQGKIMVFLMKRNNYLRVRKFRF
jgi:hypothetical protein